MVYSDAEDTLFIGGEAGTVQFFRGAADTLFAGGVAGAGVGSLAFLPQAAQTVAGREDGVLRFLQAQLGGVVGDVQENAAGSVVTAVVGLVYDDDVRGYSEVASASLDGTVKIWDVGARVRVRTLSGHTLAVLALCFLAAPEVLVSGGFDGQLGFWSMPRATMLAFGQRCIGNKAFLSTAFRIQDCLEAAISAGATYFIYGLVQSATANVCEMELSDCSQMQQADYTLYRIEQPLVRMGPAHVGSVQALEPVPDFGAAASGGFDGAVRLWDGQSGAFLREMAVASPPSAVQALAYITGLRALLVGTAAGFTYFDAATGDLLKFVPLAAQATSISHLRQLGFVAVAQEESVELWNVLERCVDGRHPISAALCELCPRDRAGSGGACQIRCRSGNWSSEDRTRCEPCPLGRAGTEGNCLACPPGRFQDGRGRVSCKRCRKGAAQPASGQTACVACVDNTVSQVVGQAVCEECAFGTEPSEDHTRCNQCPEGRAGIRGTCFQCADGEQPNPESSACVPCFPGMAGTSGLCSLCPDGSQPVSDRTSCEPCPEAFAGTGGFCARCEPGEMPASTRAFCKLCPPGQAGTDGTCSPCPRGYAPNAARTRCEECPDGQPAVAGVCTPCADGSYPAPDLSECLPCPAGYAGRNGLCFLCPWGHGVNDRRSECVPCPEAYASSVGVCYPCPNGTMPNATFRQECEACPPGRAGVGGRCVQCGDGTQQEPYNRSACEACPVGTAGRSGFCDACRHPMMQDVERVACTLQQHPAYYSFSAPRCQAHANCSEHFKHLPGLEDGSLFCCPTTHGDLLACCEFETPGTRAFFTMAANGLDSITALAEDGWLPATLGGLGLIYSTRLLLLAWRSEDWEDWREALKLTHGFPILIPVGLVLVFLVTPWLLLSMVAFGWVPVMTVVAFSLVNRFLEKQTRFAHEARKKAAKRMRPWLFAFFACDFFTCGILTIQEVLVVRFLLADLLGTLEAYVGFAAVRPFPWEYSADSLGLGLTVKEMLLWPMRIFNIPQVALANFLVHVDLYASRFSSTLLAASGLALGLASATYVLLVCDLGGRMAAAKESVLLTRTRSWRRAWRLFVLGTVDLVLSLLFVWAALVPSRLSQLLVQLSRRRPLPDGMFAAYVEFSLMLYAFCVQVLILVMWVCVAGGAHINNPPAWIALPVARWTGLEFEAARREQYLVLAVLRALNLLEEEEEDLGSARGSDTSPRSPQGSARGPRMTGQPSASPRRGSQPSTSPRVGGQPSASPRSGSPRSPKVVKNLSSVNRMLRRQSGQDSPGGSARSPRGGSPMPASGRSPRGVSPRGGSPRGGSPRSPRMPGFGRRGPKFVRLPDGSRAELGRRWQAAMGRRLSTGSPRGGLSPRGGGFSPQPSARPSDFGSPRRAFEAGPIASETFGPGRSEFASPRGSGEFGSPGRGFDLGSPGRGFDLGSPHGLSSPGRGFDGTSPRAGLGLVSPRRMFGMASPRKPVSPTNSAGNSPQTSALLGMRFWRGWHRGSGSSVALQSAASSGALQSGSSGLESPMASSRKGRPRDLLEIANWQDDSGANIADLKMTPQMLYNRVPAPKIELTVRHAIRSFFKALRASASICLGLWKGSWNAVPHTLRRRTRNLTKECSRQYYDVQDYAAMVRATSRTVAIALSWLPGGAGLAALAIRCNRPPFRYIDASMDIMKHKLEEYLERGTGYKEAELTVKKMVISKKQHAVQRAQTLRLEMIQRIVSLAILSCLILIEGLLNGDNAAILGPLLVTMLGLSLAVHALIDRVLLPLVRLQHGITISVQREVPEEKSLNEQVLAAMIESSSSETGSDSSDYSSANESFMDEDPRTKEPRPKVIGVKKRKILVRPKACRLSMRYSLMRSFAGCPEHTMRWRREDPLKYGRLLNVEGAMEGTFDGFRRRSRSVSFSPTEESDWPAKVKLHRLRRSHSLGLPAPEERLERRLQAERWLVADVCKETCLPSLPSTAAAVPPRGLIDEFEALGVFRSHTNELTDQQMCFAAPWQDTVCAYKVEKAYRRGPPPQRPWETELDEALDERERLGEEPHHSGHASRPQLVEMEEDGGGVTSGASLRVTSAASLRVTSAASLQRSSPPGSVAGSSGWALRRRQLEEQAAGGASHGNLTGGLSALSAGGLSAGSEGSARER